MTPLRALPEPDRRRRDEERPLAAPNHELAINRKTLLDRKSPIQVRIQSPPAASLQTFGPSRVGAMHRRLVYLRRENHRVPPARCRRCATGHRSSIVAHAGSACRFFVRGERSARTGDHPRKQSAAFEAAWPRRCRRLRGRVLRCSPVGVSCLSSAPGVRTGCQRDVAIPKGR